MKPHKHAEVIKAWADGATVQYRNETQPHWTDCSGNKPEWVLSTQYRVKPTSKKYRVYEYLLNNQLDPTMKAVGVHTPCVSFSTAELEKREYFVRWLGDWVEYEE